MDGAAANSGERVAALVKVGPCEEQIIAAGIDGRANGQQGDGLCGQPMRGK